LNPIAPQAALGWVHLRKSSDSGKGDAKSDAIDPELAELAAVWPSLSAIIKSVILGVARQHLETGKPKK